MDAGNWLSAIGHAGQLIVESVPQAFWFAYYWARDWQGLLGGLLLVIAAWIFSRGTLHATRIRAAALIRSAQISSGLPLDAPAHLASAPPVEKPRPKLSPMGELVQKTEQLRSLIRSAMSTLTADTGMADAIPNFYCQRIARMQFDEQTIPANLSRAAHDLHGKLASQLVAVRTAMEKRSTHEELSQALVQLNARAREFGASIAPAVQTAKVSAEQKTNRVRVQTP